MIVKYFYCFLIFYFQYQIIYCKSDKVRVTYMSTERPVVEWLDTRFFRNFTLVSRRVSRQDPRHYVEVDVHTLETLSNSVVPEFYFYQFLTNRYQPSFVELHYKFCDMINFDILFGQPMKNAIGNRTCPFPPGEYHLKNLTMPYVPTGFPFTKGRIYCNVSFVEGGISRIILRGQIDMEVKVAITRNN